MGSLTRVKLGVLPIALDSLLLAYDLSHHFVHSLLYAGYYRLLDAPGSCADICQDQAVANASDVSRRILSDGGGGDG